VDLKIWIFSPEQLVYRPEAVPALIIKPKTSTGVIVIVDMWTRFELVDKYLSMLLMGLLPVDVLGGRVALMCDGLGRPSLPMLLESRRAPIFV
jgi:hypothetical protein